MSALEVQPQSPADILIKAIEQLDKEDFNRIMEAVLRLNARYNAPCLPATEAELLLKINKGLSPELWEEYNALVAKRKAEILTEEEHKRLIELTHQVENWNAERLSYLIELAQIRQKPVRQVTHGLEIDSPGYA